jgi:hypothetical protein
VARKSADEKLLDTVFDYLKASGYLDKAMADAAKLPADSPLPKLCGFEDVMDALTRKDKRSR